MEAQLEHLESIAKSIGLAPITTAAKMPPTGKSISSYLETHSM
jgi:hypothetical protein